MVYVTAATDANVAVAALKAGAADYVPKTVGDEFFELLGTAVDQAIEKARLQLEHERAQKEVREARDRAEVLLHEVNHRVANSLALVGAFVALQAHSVSDPSVRSALGEIQIKITAIAGVHRHLYTSRDVRVVEMSDYLATLLRDLDATFKTAGHASTVRLAAERIEVPTDKAVDRYPGDRTSNQRFQVCLSRASVWRNSGRPEQILRGQNNIKRRGRWNRMDGQGHSQRHGCRQQHHQFSCRRIRITL